MPEEPALPPNASDDPVAGDEAVARELGGGGDDATPQAHRSEERQTKPNRKKYVALEWVAVVAVALLAAFVVRTYVLQTFFIPSGSMEPTLQIGDRIIVSKLSYHLHSVHRGDIIVFHAPAAEAKACADPNVKDLVKRVIGLPGETISSTSNTITINGKAIAQPWFPPTLLGNPITTTHIPANAYFVMGDNRTNSCDSRMWGTLPGSEIIGHVIFRIWPLSQIGFL
jgi:signal peptidase I